MKQKVFVVLWSYNHKSEFDCGCTLHTKREDALNELEACYHQAIENISPHDGVDGLNMHEWNKDKTPYYYVERYAADSWERGEIQENTIEF